MRHEAQAQIRYRTYDGIVDEWGIGATAADNDTTMRSHLSKWMPDCEYLGARIQLVPSGETVMDTRVIAVSRRAAGEP